MEKQFKYPIGIDARMIHHTGIGVYLRGLLGALAKNPGMREKTTLFGDAEKLSSYPFRSFPMRSPIYSLAEQAEYRRHVSLCGLWHSPHYNIPWYKISNKLIVTVHDLIHWEFRGKFYNPLKTFYVQQMFRRIALTADQIIAVSETTRDDLIRHFKIDPSRVTVIYEGVGQEFLTPPDLNREREIKAKFKLPERYFFYVGLIRPHKNIHRLIRAYKTSKRKKDLQADLVLVGRVDGKYGEFYKELENSRGLGVHHFESVSGEELRVFYHAAHALVHPSLYEGFGLTLLEAMASGVPVAASGVASIPEVTGKAAYLFDPLSLASLTDALVRLDSDSHLRGSLIRNGYENIKRFSWDDMGSKTAQLYEKVLGGGR